jgi:Cation/multidrug efflux pump
MNIAETCIRRPVMTTLVMAGILLFGIAAYRFLPVSDLPNVDFPTILVSANLSGANPETMASSVAIPLERPILYDRGHRHHDLRQLPRFYADYAPV